MTYAQYVMVGLIGFYSIALVVQHMRFKETIDMQDRLIHRIQSDNRALQRIIERGREEVLAERTPEDEYPFGRIQRRHYETIQRRHQQGARELTREDIVAARDALRAMNPMYNTRELPYFTDEPGELTWSEPRDGAVNDGPVGRQDLEPRLEFRGITSTEIMEKQTTGILEHNKKIMDRIDKGGRTNEPTINEGE